MPNKQRLYQKLPGRSLAVFSVPSLWQGSDHLLWVKASLAQECYKRFYYKDIQSIILQRTNQYAVWNFIWAVSTLLFLTIALTVSGTPYVSGVLMLIALVALLANIVRGPTCQVFIQTAVQVQKLLSLTRVRPARKALYQIRMRVIAAQGELKIDGLAAGKPDASSINVGSGIPPGASYPPHNAETQAVLEPFKPLLHQILFGLLLGAGVCRTIKLWAQHDALALLDMLFLAATLVLAMVVLVRWYHQIKGTLLAKIT